MIYKIDLLDWVGKNYNEFFKYDCKYKIYETAKNAKKSTVFARTLILKILTDPRLCVMILRKYMKDHAKTTFEDVLGAFNAFQKKTGYNWRSDWKYSNSNNGVYFKNIKTGQKILFESFDKYDSITGASLGADDSENKLYWGLIWLEEPIQKNDVTNSEISDEDLISNFNAIESTLFRGILPPNANREVWMSYNDWRPDSKFKEHFITRYVQKNEDNLIKYGKQFLYDPAAFAGAGGLWVFSGAGVNEFTDDSTRTFYKQLKEIDKDLFKVIVLGCGASFEGTAYGENLKKVSKIENLEQGNLFFGIDYSSTRDETVVTAVLISEDWWNIQIIDKWNYKDKNAEIGKKLTDPEQISQIWKFIEKVVYKYRKWMLPNKINIYVDSKDTVVRGYLNKALKDSSLQDLFNPIAPARKFGIAGKIVRVFAVRMLMGMKRICINPKYYDYYMNEWKKRVLKKNGDVKDGNDDASQSFEYSISNLFKYIFTSEQIDVLKALRNDN